MHPGHIAVDARRGPPAHPTADLKSASAPQPRSNAEKRERDPGEMPPAEFYDIAGMGDLTAREMRQNEILSKRYQKKK